MLRLMGKATAGEDDAVYAHDRVAWQAVAPRTWLARNTERFDLVMLPTIGSFGGSAGLFALHEQPLLTREALQQAWQALSADGALSITAWVDYPVRSPLRLFASLVELLEDNGLTPVKHMAAVRSWGTLTFCIKKSPLTHEEIGRARAFAEQWAFDPALLPDITDGERQRYNLLQDDTLLQLLDLVFERSGRTTLYRDYPFQLAPTSDNQPFFSQFLRWSRVDSLIDHFGQRTVPFIELGVLVAGLAATILTLLAVILIILPLARLPGETGSRRQTFLYFGGLGVGYMWFELAMIHRFEFYLGQPVYAASLVVAVLLIGSAIGSAISSRCSESRASRSAIMVFLTLCIYTILLSPILQASLQLPFVLRIAFSIVLLVPAALLMGMPFPLGLRLLNQRHAAGVPWAWGINGCLSVVGAAVATLIAVEAGYNTLLLLAAGAYLLPSLCGFRSSGGA